MESIECVNRLICQNATLTPFLMHVNIMLIHEGCEEKLANIAFPLLRTPEFSHWPKGVDMFWIFVLWVFQSLHIVVLCVPSSMPPYKSGCYLVLNNGRDEMEPIGNPLLIHIRFSIHLVIANII